MAEQVEGLYIDLGMNWQETLQGEQAVIAALRQMEQSANRLGQQMVQAMKEISANTYETGVATLELKEAQEQQAAAAQKQARATDQAGDSSKRARVDVEGLARGLTALALVTAGVSAAIIKLSKDSIDAFNQQTAAYEGLETVARRTGAGVEESRQTVERLFKDLRGMISEAQLAQSVKNLESLGYTASETERLIRGLADAAAYNRQSMFTMGEAVVRSTEGIKNGNSFTADAVGITKNLTVILREMGKSEQDLQRIQSDASVQQALLNGVLKEAATFQGDAARYADTLAGSQAKLAAETQRAKAALGEGLAPALKGLLETVVPAVQNFGEWARQNPETARTVIIVTASVVGLTGALSALATVLVPLLAAMGPAGWWAAGAALTAGAITGLAVANRANAAATREQADRLSELADEYDALKAKTNLTTAEQAELRNVIDQIAQLAPGAATGFDSMGKALDVVAEKARAASRELQEIYLLQAKEEMQDLQRRRPDLEAERARLGPEVDRLRVAAANDESFYRPGRGQVKARTLLLEYLQAVQRVNGELARLEQLQAEVAFGEARMKLGGLPGSLDVLPETEAMRAFARGSGAGAGDDDKLSDAVRKRLKEIDRLRQEGRITLQQEQEMLRDALDGLAQTAEDAAELQHRIIMVGNQIRQESVADSLAWVDSIRKAGGPQALEDEMAAIERVLQKWGPQLSKEQKRQLQDRMRDIQAAIPARDLAEGLKALDREIAAAVREGLPESTQAMLRIGGLQKLLDIPGLMERDRQKLQDQIADLLFGLGKQQFEETMAGITALSQRRQREAEDQIARLEAEAQAAETSTSRQIEIADEIHRIKRDAYQQEIQMLQAVVEATEAGTEQRQKAEEALAAAQGRLRDADLEHARTVEQAKTQALRAAEQAALDLIRRTEQQMRTERQRTYDQLRKQLQESYAQRRSAIQDEIAGIDEQLEALERQWRAEDRRRERERLEAEADAIRGNIDATRRMGGFFKVDPASGRLVETFDEERVRELEGQLAQNREQVAELEREAAREARRQALEDQKAYLQERLARLQESLQAELDALAEHWEGEGGLLDQERIHQDALAQIQAEAQGRRMDGLYDHLFGPDGVIPTLEDAAKHAEELWARILSAQEAIDQAQGGGGTGPPGGDSSAAPPATGQTMGALLAAAAGVPGAAPVVSVQLAPEVPMQVTAVFDNVTDADGVIDALTRIGGQAAGMLAARIRTT